MSEYVTDPELLKKLNAGSSDEYVNDPELLKKLNAGSTVDESDLVQKGVQAALPAITGANTPTGLAQLYDEANKAAKPLVSATVSPIKEMYKAHPLMSLAADVGGAYTTGVPFATAGRGILSGAEGLYNKYKSAKEGLNVAQQFLTESERIPVSNAQGQAVVDAAGNAITKPAARDAYRALQNLNPELGAEMTKVFGKNTGGGGLGALAEYLKSPAAAEYLKTPGAQQLADEIIGKVPGMGAQAMKIAGPVLRGVGRVAGPVGIGMDIYDAGKYAQESGLGQRLAQGQGQQAEQAFRGMANQNVSGYQPTPQEATNIMESQDQRIIKMYGGPDRLRELIRAKAAVKALGL
jgi:hypothetical protein